MPSSFKRESSTLKELHGSHKQALLQFRSKYATTHKHKVTKETDRISTDVSIVEINDKRVKYRIDRSNEQHLDR